MTPEQQWQEDVKQFGELAYLMWEASLTEDKRQRFSDIFPTENLTVVTNMLKPDVFILRRKQSAALPFDKAAAIAGDVVECLIGGDWFEIKGVFKKSRDSKYVVFVDSNKNRNLIALDNLRMKHPRRVGVDYSQFEDKT